MTIRTTTLPGGLRVCTDAMDGVASATVGVWVGVGTRHERPELNGVAHLVEHMVFKGTPRRSAAAISEQIEDVGGQLNAYTTREHTAYYARVLHEDVGLALDIIADMLQHALFDEEELARERGVVLQEIGQAEDTPDDIIYDHFQARAFPDQGLGRPVLGRPDVVASLSRTALVEYLADHYGAPAMVVTAAGHVDHEALVELSARLFAELPVEARCRTEPARYAGGDYREARELEQLHLLLGFEGVGCHDPDHYALSVLSTLLGGGMSSRLFQEVRERRGLVYSIYSFASSYVDGGLFGIYAGTGPDQVDELVPVVCDEICRVAEDASDAEVARTPPQLKASLLMAQESSMARAEQLGQQMLLFGRPLPPEEIVGRLAAVDAEAVRRVARRLRASRPTVAALGPLSGLESYERIAARLS